MPERAAFLTEPREAAPRRAPAERVRDWNEIYLPFPDQSLRKQASRCMDCGVPFCHSGCPLTNLIPDWNELVREGKWRAAVRLLHATNNFPEFTGRICPAPCEAACVLGINTPAVTIKQIEKTIIDRAFEAGFVQPEPPAARTGKRVAVVGSGPAGLAAAQQLARMGHSVTVFEKSDRIGGLLRYGIPDFKMEKRLIDRRLDQMRAEGVEFRTGVHVGVDVQAEELRADHDAVLLAGGAEQPRDLRVPGRELAGIHFAMEYLPQQNRRCEGDEVPGQILATGKHVVIIGGGDTGADCLGTCHRQGALSVTQFELLQKPPEERSRSTPWPLWPMQLRTEGAHEEGGKRDWSVSTVGFTGDAMGRVRELQVVRVDTKLNPVPGTEFSVEAGLVLLAMGFTGPVKRGLLDQLGVHLDARGNVATDVSHMSSVPGVFAAGDMRRGQSLVVWAIAEGRRAAAGIDRYLSGLSG
ncbi:MAG: glutamate synthase subunit beta [Bryobacteraceae bacterium]|jgi:glutamate synthase (NADPH/NADH) small chain